MLSKHGVTGPYAVLAIWGHMMEHFGRFNADDEFDLIGIADHCQTTADNIKLIVISAHKSDLIQLVDNSKLTPSALGVYTKLKIEETIKILQGSKKKASNAGIASGEKRKLNSKLTPSALQVEQKERKNLLPKVVVSSEVISSNGAFGSLALVGPFTERHGIVMENQEDKIALEKLLLRNQKSKWRHEIEDCYKSLHPNFQKLLKKSPLWFVETQWSPELGGWETGSYLRYSESNPKQP